MPEEDRHLRDVHSVLEPARCRGMAQRVESGPLNVSSMRRLLEPPVRVGSVDWRATPCSEDQVVVERMHGCEAMQAQVPDDQVADRNLAYPTARLRLSYLPPAHSLSNVDTPLFTVYVAPPQRERLADPETGLGHEPDLEPVGTAWRLLNEACQLVRCERLRSLGAGSSLPVIASVIGDNNADAGGGVLPDDSILCGSRQAGAEGGQDAGYR